MYLLQQHYFISVRCIQEARADREAVGPAPRAAVVVAAGGRTAVRRAAAAATGPDAVVAAAVDTATAT